jgi:hypothetical protein
MFPGPRSQIIYNEAGEPLGWDEPSEPDYCAECGGPHSTFQCNYNPDPDEDYDDED